MLGVLIFFSAILGLLIGSFLNVVALRWNTGKGVSGRSGCFSCGGQLTWKELVPVFSWLIQRGRCRACSSRISPMYLLGEVLTMGFFAAITARAFFFGIDFWGWQYAVGTLYLFIVAAILVVIFLYDLRHQIIPDRLSLAFALMGFASLFFFSSVAEGFIFSGFAIPNMLSVLAGIIVPLPFFLIWLVSRGRWIGLGDPKLMVGIGLFLGIAGGFSAVILSFWIGSLFVIFRLLLPRLFFKKTLLKDSQKSIMKQELAFGPFLIIAFMLTLVSKINIFLLYTL